MDHLLADIHAGAGLEKAIARGDGDPWDGLRIRLQPAGQKGLLRVQTSISDALRGLSKERVACKRSVCRRVG